MSARTFFTLHVIAATMLWAITIRAQAPASEAEFDEADPVVAISVDNLALELQKQGVIYWRVVLSQAIIETGWNFNSAVFRNANNFIGMRIPGARPSMRNGAYRGYSAYAKWQDCVADIKIWQEYFWKGGTREQYVAKMNRVWAQAPDYGYHIRKLLKKFDERFPAQVTAVTSS